jgi:hypothetical protein
MITESKDFPAVTKQFIKLLKERFPQKDFDTATSLRDLDFHYGQRSVVNFLESVFKDQNDNPLN